MAVNTSAIQNLLRPGLRSLVVDYPMYQPQWKEIFDTYDSDKAFETDVEMKMLGLADIRAEGAATIIDTMGQRIITNYVHKYISLGFIITRSAMINNLYKSKFPMYAKSLRNSMAQTKEIIGASVLNNAGRGGQFAVGDGQPLLSLNHPIDGGVYANRPAVPADFSVAAIEAANIAIRKFKDQAGLTVMLRPMKAIIPPEAEYTAARILHSTFMPNTANNDINPVNYLSTLPEGYTVNQFLNDPKSWFIKTNCDDGFKHYVREKLQTHVTTDFDTDNLKAKALECYSFGVTNPRCVYGSVSNMG